LHQSLHQSKETPADAEIASHRLMLRAGMIRKLAAGLYTWLPLGLRVLRKVERIVREEMDRGRRAGGGDAGGAAGGAVAGVRPLGTVRPGAAAHHRPPPARVLLRPDPRGDHHRSRTRNEVKSYKQLPVNFYQIQTKFATRSVPRFGVMRAREFLMKDAYSFHLDQASLAQTYEVMYETYSRIFEPLRARLPRRCRRTPAASAATLARVPRAGGLRRGRHRLLHRWQRLCRQRRAGRGAGAGRATARRPPRSNAHRSTRRAPRPSPTCAEHSASPSNAPSRRWWWPRPDPETGDEPA
jgi:hypothetical protein